MSARRLALIGPPGSGKSALAKRYVRKYGGYIYDTDAEFVRRYGDIAEFFKNRGEAEFRKLEQDIMIDAAKSDATVVSTGGGGVLSRVGMNALRKACTVICLDAPPAVLYERIKNSARPLKNDLYKLLEERRPLYDRYADYIVDSSVSSMDELERALTLPRPNRYDIVLCDSDDTLLDFQTARSHCIHQTVKTLGLGVDPETVDAAYKKVIRVVWKRIENGELTKAQLELERVRSLSEEIGVAIDADSFNASYISEMKKTRFVIDGAIEFLDALAGRGIKSYIITNSFSELADCRLQPVVSHTSGAFVSERIGAYKPSREFFDAVHRSIGQPDKARVLVFGDGESSDIAGGRDYGYDTCLFDPTRQKQTEADHTVGDYAELLSLL